MKNEYKSFALQEVKATNDGAGFVEGIGNTLFDLDNYGDIAIDYKGIDDLVKNGSVYDQHGATDGDKMGAYTVGKQLATIDSAKQQAEGLFVRWEWHTDQTSQNYKAKIQDRIDRKKNVFLSIGYKLAEPAKYIYASEFKSELPKYIPAAKLQTVLSKAQGLQRVRLIVPKVNEITITPNPVNENSTVTGYKSMDNIEFTEKEFKAEFLGEDISDVICCAAIDRLWCRAQGRISNLLMPWDSSIEEDETAEALSVNGILDEFNTMAKMIYAKMSELEAMSDTPDELKAAYSDPKEFEFKGRNLAAQGQQLVKAFSAFQEKFEMKAGREFSGKNEKQTRQIQTVAKDIEAKAKSISKSVDSMLASLPSNEMKALEEKELEFLELQDLQMQSEFLGF